MGKKNDFEMTYFKIVLSTYKEKVAYLVRHIYREFVLMGAYAGMGHVETEESPSLRSSCDQK